MKVSPYSNYAPYNFAPHLDIFNLSNVTSSPPELPSRILTKRSEDLGRTRRHGGDLVVGKNLPEPE